MNPKLSVVIPAYNYANTIERAIHSVLSQMKSDVELIVINDGSTDNTKEVLEQIAQKEQVKFRVFTKANGGAASARNLGLDKGKGSYFVFLDADDEMATGAVDAILDFIETYPSVRFVIGGHQSILPSQKTKDHMPKSLPNDSFERVKGYLIDKKISLSNGACVMHKCIFEHIRYPEHFRNSEDIPVFAYVMANCECAVLPKILAKIYKHEDSLRHHLGYTESVGAHLIDEVFNPFLIPAHILKLKKPYAAQRFLSLSRVAYDAKQYKKSRHYFFRAFLIKWVVIFKLAYTKKMIKSLFADFN
jgi:glycosyltransferase involved in cell wall biosynthesis